MSFADCAEKFYSCASGAIKPLSREAAEKVMDMVSQLEKMDNPAEIMNLLSEEPLISSERKRGMRGLVIRPIPLVKFEIEKPRMTYLFGFGQTVKVVNYTRYIEGAKKI